MFATIDQWGAFVAPLVAFVLLLGAQRYLGRWPDLWRFRRAVLPVLDRLADGNYDAELEAVDEHTSIDVSAAADALPEKTGVPLQAREFVGTIKAPPSVVREELRQMERVYPNTLASIQFDVVDEGRVWEVGSYAYRPEGFLGMWQYHVRLTPAAGGRKTRLWAHYERSAWRAPVRHYNADGWDAEEGVREVASWFASDDRFEASERIVELISGR
ncbi:hypothetical protein DJ73_13105 [Halorubrum sp. Ea1]|uniref:hypothetical protein n=1 Tax=Halorubrum sp. Ea1 TaxID=1480718 RepID=UPI000B999453|nr:hypothetical protein [Halorubrum sp. Ea1]OYR51528.1 hypothetical protein DJ73_13105 [Halorubrum sp. Ea1]